MDTIMTRKVGFLLLPRFSMLSLMSALEPLRVANRFAGELYQWSFIGATTDPELGDAVLASNGIPVSVTPMGEINKLDRLFVCASYAPQDHLSPAITNWLKHRARQSTHIGSLETGCYALAAADLIHNHNTAMHWESQAAFNETYPKLNLCNSIFNDDGKRFTCAGGSASMDLVLHQISQDQNEQLADRVASSLVHQRYQQEEVGQRSILLHSPQQIALKPVIEAMAANIEIPLEGVALAAIQKVSERTLQRQFKQAFGMPARSWYLQMRLQRARQLLHESNLTVMQAGIACGFGSNENFCRQYKTMFGHPPSRDRKLDYASAFSSPVA
jgi:AraC family carnitine catabolism transcriptional activator